MIFHDNLRREDGATLLEFGIAALVLFPLLLALTDWARFMSVQGTLNKAANHALTVAQTIPGIEARGINPPVFDDAIDQIQREAAQLTDASNLLHSGMSQLSTWPDEHRPVEVILPLGNLESALVNTPIEVESRAKFRFFFPFVPPLTVTGRAIGFREPRSVPSEPIPVDCMGNPVGSSHYNNWCPCAANSIYSAGACTPCAPGMHAVNNVCQCNDDPPCPGELVKDSTHNCECRCPTSPGWPDPIRVGDTCPCGPGTVKVGDKCACFPAPVCTGGRIADASCGCVCSGTIWYEPLQKCLPSGCATKPGCPELGCVCPEL